MKAQFFTEDIQAFLQEDLGTTDLTAELIPVNTLATAELITREKMVLCGCDWFNAVFKNLNSDVSINWFAGDGDMVAENTLLCSLNGSARALLTGERTALNLLQTLSATATIARAYALAVEGTTCKILDTRKTIPGLRKAQKYAVVCGGCYNHRMGLYDGVLIKENHILAIGSIAKAVQLARSNSNASVEVEVETLAELKEAIIAKPDRIMLDNFSLEELKAAVTLNAGQIELEASGNIDLANIREVAETGVHFISTGALTKHIKAVDLSLRIAMVSQ
jgi:nicotinate-nucleotide pyrophosphorylase (carboxylating)